MSRYRLALRCIAIAILLAGCEERMHAGTPAKPRAERNTAVYPGVGQLTRYDDEVMGVSCYQVYGYTGLACVRVQP